jgi:protein involved in polysaccharide export with SLBB domain
LKETRIKLQDHLKEFHENTRVIISPAAINSKTFTIMGMVQNSGVFTMDREITALEAIARAGGIVTGVVNGNTQELADLKRSIIVRDGRPLKVDLEALLARGDLTQNIPLEPRDYVYIQPNLSNQYFLFGAVNKPGNQVMTPGATLVRALSENGGFADGAWRSKILLVRGSLDQPKSYIVDVAQVLKGKARDVQLETGDIVYVHTEPWHVIERILDNAIEAFLQSAVSTWVDIELFDIDPNATNEIDGSNNSSGSAP